MLASGCSPLAPVAHRHSIDLLSSATAVALLRLQIVRAEGGISRSVSSLLFPYFYGATPPSHVVRRTLAISCEAVPAFPSPRGHEAALRPRNGAAESFVSFIALFGGTSHSTNPLHELLQPLLRRHPRQ